MAVEAGEVQEVRGVGVHFYAGDGLVEGGVGGGVDFLRRGFGEVEEAEGGVVGGGVEMGRVVGGELKGGYCAGVEVEGVDGRVWAVVFFLFFFVFVSFRFDGFVFYRGGGLRGVEETEVAHFVAGEDKRLVGDGVKAQGVDSFGGDFNP